MSSNTMYAGRVFDAEVIAGGGGTATSPAVRLDSATTLSMETKAFSGTLNVDYTYELSSDGDVSGAVWTAPSAGAAIGTHTVLDFTDFAPEAAKYIRIIATNNDVGAVTLTSVLHMQEA